MTQIEMEETKLEQLASEYRRKGYRVAVRPRAHELPAFLSPFQPDLLATSGDDHVVIELRSSPDLASESLVQLAEAVESHSGWRFELVIMNPQSAPEVPAHAELASEHRIESLLLQAQALSGEKRYEFAAIVAWAAAEAIFRRLALSSGIHSERKSSGTVLKQLYVLGVINPDQYDIFSRALEFRNAFVHGFVDGSSADVTSETIEHFIQEIAELKSRPAA